MKSGESFKENVPLIHLDSFALNSLKIHESANEAETEPKSLQQELLDKAEFNRKRSLIHRIQRQQQFSRHIEPTSVHIHDKRSIINRSTMETPISIILKISQYFVR